MVHEKKINFKILVPVYNVEKYIDECIKSVINQTYDAFELILVDDGSPDKCGEICDKYAKLDKRITVIHQENRGSMAARRAAIDYVIDTNDDFRNYILFLDSDDSLKENALEVVLSAIKKTGCDMIVFGMDRVMNGEIVSSFEGETEQIITDKRALYNKVFNSSAYNSLCRKAVSINLFIKEENYTQYYMIRHGEDLLQSLPLYKNCKKVFFLNKALYNYTVNLKSITQSICYENYNVDYTVRKTVFDFLINEQVFSHDDFSIYRSYCINLIIDQCMRICGFNTTTNNKINLLKQIYDSEYYQEYIYKKVYYKNMVKGLPIYKMLENQKYKLLILSLRIIIKILQKRKRSNL